MSLPLSEGDSDFSAAVDYVTQQLPSNRNSIESDAEFREQLYLRLGD